MAVGPRCLGAEVYMGRGGRGAEVTRCRGVYGPRW